MQLLYSLLSLDSTIVEFAFNVTFTSCSMPMCPSHWKITCKKLDGTGGMETLRFADYFCAAISFAEKYDECVEAKKQSISHVDQLEDALVFGPKCQ